MSAVGDPLLDPGFHFLRDPRHPASAQRYPLGKLAGGFKASDVREAVGNAVNRFEFLLRNELPCHCKSLVERDVATPG